MKRFWTVLSAIALFGMIVGILAKDQLTFGINAAAFMFDLYMILFAEN
jgi:hypothetical protein